MSRSFNELSEVTVTAESFDASGNPYTPANARYKVNDCRTDSELIAWTTIAVPAQSMDIVIPGSANAIIGDRRREEEKVITVNTDNGLSSAHYEDYRYKIRNLPFVT